MADTIERSGDELLNGDATSPFMIVCEHASNHIPEKYNRLGLAEELLERHIAWDPGAAIVTRRLSEKLNAPALLGGFSRLLYDCNRPNDAFDAVPVRSEIYDIPGNLDLSESDMQERINSFYLPFHATLTSALDAMSQQPVLVTIHSFTPVYHGHEREVEIGILHGADARLADAMVQLSSEHIEMNVQKNEPYGPDDGVMHTLERHGVRRGILNVMIEIRNDFLITEEQCVAIADMLAELLINAVDACSSPLLQKRVST